MRRMCVHDGYARHRYRLHQCEDRGCRDPRGPRFVRGHPRGLGSVLHPSRWRQGPSPPRRAPGAGHRLPAHQGQPRRNGPGAPCAGRGGPARGQHHRRAGHGHRRPAGRPDPRHHLRERVQSHRPRHRRAAPERHHRLRDGRRDVQVHQAGDRPSLGPGGHRRLRHQRRLRRGHRVVHGPAGQPPPVRHRGRGRHRPGRRQGRVHRRALLGLRQIRHDPRPAEGLSASRGAQRPVQRRGAQLPRHHHQGQGDRRTGGLHRRRGGQLGGGRGAARGFRDRPPTTSSSPPTTPGWALSAVPSRPPTRRPARRWSSSIRPGSPWISEPTSRPATCCPWTGSSSCATG